MFGDRRKLPRIVPHKFIEMLPEHDSLRNYLKHPNWKAEENNRDGVKVFGVSQAAP
jgi:hypothetical protein